MEGIDDAGLAADSLLAGWSRATVVAHLAYGARATARMVREAPGGTVAFYPGGAQQREDSLRDAVLRARAELVRDLEEACAQLHSTVVDLPAQAWDAAVREPRLGAMAQSRLLVLRLTEVEVHHADLGLGVEPRDWLDGFVDLALPLRLRWLGAHHRHRSAESHGVNGSWRLVRTDTGQAWVVQADGIQVTVTSAHGDVDEGPDCDVTLHAEGWELLGLLLGRGEMVRTPRGARFKAAFPGP